MHLKIKNNDDEDCAIVLASTSDPSKALLLVYVRSNSSCTIKSIKNGTYIIYFVTGEDWDAYTKKFTRDVYYEKFEETARYTAKYPKYYIITIELGITGGSARSLCGNYACLSISTTSPLI